MRSIMLSGTGGGQGVTTIALGLALKFAQDGPVLYVFRERDDAMAAADYAGVFYSDAPTSLADNVVMAPMSRLAEALRESAYVACIFDAGRVDAETSDRADMFKCKVGDDTATYVVTRGPSYVGLKCALRADYVADGAIVVREPDRALSARDVAGVLGVKVVAEVDIAPAIARAADAGLLGQRLPKALATSLRSLA